MIFLTDYEQHLADLCADESKRCSLEYWNSRAENNAYFIVNSDFDHGRIIFELEKKSDMTICCHSVWHFLDLFVQIEQMQQVGRGYCALYHSIHTPYDSSQLIQKLGMP